MNVSKGTLSSTFGVVDGRKCNSNKNVSKFFSYSSNVKMHKRESDLSNFSYGDENVSIIEKPDLPYPGIFSHLKG
jgi:hypothetical protein